MALSRDLVPIRERIAGLRETGKPLQIAVESAPGTIEAKQRPGQFRPHPRPARSARRLRADHPRLG
jgi:hypothetical protein